MIRSLTLIMVLTPAAMSVVTMPAGAEEFQLLIGRDPGLAPGAVRMVAPSGPPAGANGFFNDGDRLAGTSDFSAAPYLGTGTPLVNTNQYGALSFMYRRGSIPIGPAGWQPVLAVDFLGGPKLDLDGDLGNGARRLTPMAGQTPVEIPGSHGSIGLSLDTTGGMIALTGFDATSTNQGFGGFGPGIAVTVNTLAGTQPDTTSGAAINPSVDSRQGTMALHAPHVWRVSDLGYEMWQDSIDPTSSTASTLGTFQYLGALDGWVIERDGGGNFPTLAGLGLGSTAWPAVDTSVVGSNFMQSNGAMVPIAGGTAGDLFSAPNNGGLPLADFGADLGAYLDAVVLPAVDPLSQRVVFLESAGFGMNNSFDPVFGDTNGYDMVLVAQSTPIPEPATAALLMLGAVLGHRRRTRR